MYSIIYHIFWALKRTKKRRMETNKPSLKILTYLIGYCEWFYNIPVRRWYERHLSRKCGINQKPRAQKVIVSFTSFPKRIHDVWLVVETLLRQSCKPDEIILWLASTQFPNGLSDLPKNLLRQQSRGLTIRFCDDLRSHKKYYYTLQEHPNDLVILADDDMFYPRDTVRKLLKMHKKWPDDICCITAEVMEPSFHTIPSLWRNPHLHEQLEHSDRIQAYTGSGALIPPESLHPDTFNREAIQRLCLHADDLWVAFMAHRLGTRTTTLKKWRPFPVTIYGTAEGSLYYINGEGKQNDVQWQNLLDTYTL